MKFLIGMVVLALGIYWGAKQGYIGGQWIGKIFGLGPPAGDAALDQVVKNTNSRLPRMVTSDISFERVTANQQEVIFHYRFVDMDYIGAVNKYGPHLPEVEASIIRDVCNDGEVKKYVFGGGYAAQVVLRATEVKPILSTYVRANRCR
jgi:hypothetical protein